MKKYILYNKNRMTLLLFSWVVMVIIDLIFSAFSFPTTGSVEKLTLVFSITRMLVILSIVASLIIGYFKSIIEIDDEKFIIGMIYKKTVLLKDINEVVINMEYIRLTYIYKGYNKKIYIHRKQNVDFFEYLKTYIEKNIENEKILYNTYNRGIKIEGVLLYLDIVLIGNCILAVIEISRAVGDIKSGEGLFFYIITALFIAVSLVMLFLSIKLSIGFSNKKMKCINEMKIYALVFMIYIIIGQVFKTYTDDTILNRAFNAYFYISLVQMMIRPLILIEYLKISVRVKETFIN